MTSLIAPVELHRDAKQRTEHWALWPVGSGAGQLWLCKCVSCGKLRLSRGSQVAKVRRCLSCGLRRRDVRQEAAFFFRINARTAFAECHPLSDYGYDSTKLAVAESELMLGSVSAWYTEADAEACESWSPAESKRDHLQVTTKRTKAAKKRMSVAAKKRWAKRREQKAQAAE